MTENAIAVSNDSFSTMIERLATNKDVDVEKLERMLAMQERILAKQGEMAFNEAMRACQDQMPAILRNRENAQTNSRYADLEAVNNAIVPVYTKHGFSLSFGTADCPVPLHYRVTCLVSHTGGHSRPYQADIPIDAAGIKGTANKTGTHAFGSTMSYGRRYVTLMIFNLTLTNEDNDAQRQRQGSATPTTGAWDGISMDTRHALEGIADEVIERLKAGDDAGAAKHLADQQLPAEEKVALWTLLDSKQRSAIKRAMAAPTSA